MKLNRQILLLLALAIVASVAAILTFRSRPPAQFGHALFGDSERIELIVHGREVYYDVNGDGVADRHEKFERDGNAFQVVSSDGTTRYQLTQAVVGLSPDSVSEQLPQQVKLEVNIHAVDQPNELLYQQAGQVNVYAQPRASGWASFDRPMAFEFFDEGLRLPAAGGPSIDLRVAITTPGVLDSNMQPGCRSNSTHAVPGTLVPVVTIAFPTVASAEPIVKRYELDQFC